METQDIAFIFNTFSFLINGILVMLMAAGFLYVRSWYGKIKKCSDYMY